MPESAEIAREQQYVSMLYERLDDARVDARMQLREIVLGETTGTDQGMTERDSLALHYQARIDQLDAVERGLCFGRLDRVAAEMLYIGRMGLADDDRNTLLVDWRAPAAQPFYQATAAAPAGVSRRRQLRTKDRTVIGIDDDLLDAGGLADDEVTLAGEAALLASLRAGRTGRLGDIVATIQAEQDRAIRTDLPGILVVQGGPGTGKTVVALHRVAYLLYTHRDRLARRGVLVVGPNPTFLRYIDQVLPSLGETDVVLATVGQLYPGVDADAVEPIESAALKGELRMVEVLAAAVAEWQRVPERPLDIQVEDDTLTLSPAMCRRARGRARAARDREAGTPLPHNRARRTFVETVVRALTAQWVRRLGWADEQDEKEMRAEVRASPSLRQAIDTLWPVLAPEQVLAELFAAPDRMSAAGLSPADIELLQHNDPQWTAADVPLLDEVAELLGEDIEETSKVAATEAAEMRAEVEYAKGVMDIFGLGQPDPVWHEKRAALFASRYRGADQHGSTVEQASKDRGWTFGHVVVDEAQERSPMDWRMIMRRCPSRSMTIVGDFAQAGSPAAPRSWGDALDPYAAGSWQVRELTVNYRTPRPIMDLAAGVLAAVRPDVTPPRSVRDSIELPWQQEVAASELADRVADAVAAELAVIGDGQLAVISPAAHYAELQARIGAGTALDEPIAVLTVPAAKGLEFDAVIIVEPAEIWAESPRGGNDLYVALTRSTRRLGLIHSGQLPAELSHSART